MGLKDQSSPAPISLAGLQNSKLKKRYAKPKITILDPKTAARELAARMSLGGAEAERMLKLIQARNKE